MAIYKAELKRLNREAYAQRNADNYTGDWDDRLPIDQVEKNNKIKTSTKILLIAIE